MTLTETTPHDSVFHLFAKTNLTEDPDELEEGVDGEEDAVDPDLVDDTEEEDVDDDDELIDDPDDEDDDEDDVDEGEDDDEEDEDEEPDALVADPA